MKKNQMIKNFDVAKLMLLTIILVTAVLLMLPAQVNALEPGDVQIYSTDYPNPVGVNETFPIKVTVSSHMKGTANILVSVNTHNAQGFRAIIANQSKVIPGGGHRTDLDLKLQAYKEGTYPLTVTLYYLNNSKYIKIDEKNIVVNVVGNAKLTIYLYDFVFHVPVSGIELKAVEKENPNWWYPIPNIEENKYEASLPETTYDISLSSGEVLLPNLKLSEDKDINIDIFGLYSKLFLLFLGILSIILSFLLPYYPDFAEGMFILSSGVFFPLIFLLSFFISPTDVEVGLVLLLIYGGIDLALGIANIWLRAKHYLEVRKWEREEKRKTVEKKRVKKRTTRKSITNISLPPELAEKYGEVKFIGQGGFACVFKAKRRSDGRIVAVKIPISLDETTGKSFIREIENWTKLDHPNIVKVYDYNILPIPYVEMELCDKSLADLKKPMKPKKAARFIFDICEGLKYAHSKGIVHRDLKPQNIMLKGGIPKISDWGLSKAFARAVRSKVSSFTPAYAAPEQLSKRFGNKNDPKVDVWQLGVVFYELVTGRLPFEGDDLVSITSAIMHDNPVPPSKFNPKAKDVEDIIMRCLEKKQAERCSLEELQSFLASYLGMVDLATLKKS